MAGAIAAFVAWLGASAIVLSDVRRGLALGLGLATFGLSGLAWSSTGPAAGLALAAGGAVATFTCARRGPDGWAIMPAGSTPRLILAIAGALVSLWIAASITTGAGAPVRFAVLAVVGMMGGRVITSREPGVILAAVAVMALAVAEASSLTGGVAGVVTYGTGALVAAGAMLIRVPAADAA